MFFVFVTIAILGIGYAGCNIYNVVKSGITSDMDVFKMIGKQIAAGIIVSISGIGAIVSGIVWIVHQF